MRHFAFLTVAVITALLAGCATSEQVVTLQHPETLDVVECRATEWDSTARAEQSRECVSSFIIDCRVDRRPHEERKRQIAACVRGFEKKGYVAVDDTTVEK